MKNLAVLLRKEGKQSTKLYDDLFTFDVSNGRVNLSKLEVDQLSPTQKRQLKSMKFSDDVQIAVDAALSGVKTKEKVPHLGSSQERRNY